MVHEREATDKATGLPDLVKVPQVLAAGWHGIGTAHAAEAPVFERRAGYRNAPLPSGPQAGGSQGAAWSSAESGHDPAAATPAELVAALNERPMPPTPTFDYLAARLPGEVRDRLATLIDGGKDPESVVLVFLHLLSESEAGCALDRQRRRWILAAYKKLSVDDGTVGAVRRIWESWTACRS